MKKYTDKELLDFLQAKNDEATYTGLCMFRISDTGRGWRLHESTWPDAKKSVREAIADALVKAEKE